MRPQRCGGCHPEHFFFRPPRRDSEVSAECLAALRQRLSGDSTGTAPSWYVDTWSQCHLRKRQTVPSTGRERPQPSMWLAPRDKAEIIARKDAEQTPAIQPSSRVSPLGSGMGATRGRGGANAVSLAEPRRASPSSGGRCDLQRVEPGSNQGSRAARAAGWPAGSVTVHVSRDNHHCGHF